MSDFNKKYQEIITELEKNVKNTSELNLIKSKLSELVIYLTDMVSKSVEMEDNVGKMDRNIKRLQRRINDIENDIYMDSEVFSDDLEEMGYDQMHDNDYEFEITCPYCDYEFITDNSYKNQVAIRCPKCNKVIELDWSTEDNNDSSDEFYYDEDEESAEKASKISEDNEEFSVDVKTPNNKKNKKDNNKIKNKKDQDNDDDM